MSDRNVSPHDHAGPKVGFVVLIAMFFLFVRFDYHRFAQETRIRLFALEHPHALRPAAEPVVGVER